MDLKQRLDEQARQELAAERARHTAALAESDPDPAVFLHEFEAHLSHMTEITQRLARRVTSRPARPEGDGG